MFKDKLNFRKIDIFNFIIDHLLNLKYYLVVDTKREKFTKDWLDIAHQVHLELKKYDKVQDELLEFVEALLKNMTKISCQML